MESFGRGTLLLITVPFALLIVGVLTVTALSAFGCNPHYREIVLSAEGEWIDPPRSWEGKLPAADSLHPVFFENRGRARALGVCR